MKFGIRFRLIRWLARGEPVMVNVSYANHFGKHAYVNGNSNASTSYVFDGVEWTRV